jgi:hypothetical protein
LQCEWYFKPSFLENPWEEVERVHQIESELVPFEIKEVAGVQEQVVQDNGGSHATPSAESMETPTTDNTDK